MPAFDFIRNTDTDIDIKIYLLFLLLCLFGLLYSDGTEAQSLHTDQDSIDTFFEIRSAFLGSTGDQLPFWLHTNRNGRVDYSGTNIINELEFRHLILEREYLKIRTGANTVFRWLEQNSAHFSELYLRAEAFGYQLSAGRWVQPVGLNNHDLSIGSMMVSNNATPLPSIAIETADYLNVPGLNGVVQYHSKYAHGWFEEDRYMSNAYLHQKYLYLRINYGSFSAIGGLVHNAQWAGFETVRDRRAPQSFRDYLRVVFAQSAREGSDANEGEFFNKLGNSVAGYDFGLLYRHDDYNLSITRLFYHEDTVSHRFRNPWDGVWGANITFHDRNRPVNGFTYEHINTKNQSALSFELIGRRNYYGHFLYKNGWTYEKRTLGIPLILLEGESTVNNVLVGHHIGLSGKLANSLAYKLLATYSRNYGIQDDWVDEPDESIPNDREDIVPLREFRTDQYSWVMAFRYNPDKLQNFNFSLDFSGDMGDLYQNQLGVMFGVGYRIGN